MFSSSSTIRPIQQLLLLFSEIIHTLYFRWLQTGGLYDITKPSSLELCHRTKHTFTKSRSSSLKGVEATLWRVVKKGAWSCQQKTHQQEPFFLLVLNTHLDPWHPDNRRDQLEELEQVLFEQTREISATHVPDLVWERTGVLVVGDLNIKADSQEFDEIIGRRHGWRDLFHGFKKDEGRETYAKSNSLAAYPEDCGRIDYMLAIDKIGDADALTNFLPLRAIARSVDEQPPGNELSDHSALSMEVIPDFLEYCKTVGQAA